jgi:hypothetical protein
LTSKERLDRHLYDFKSFASRLIGTNERLAEDLRQRKQMFVSDTAAVAILREALAGAVGWRERARALLGLSEQLVCKKCGDLFPSGGKRKKSCGKCK